MADRPNNRGRKSRKKVCGFCVDKVEHIDVTGTCARHQRDLTTAIKRARHLALLPYTAD